MKLSAHTVSSYILFALLFTSVCMIFGRTAVRLAVHDAAQTAVQSEIPVFLIDPGHGGEDGGAECSGILEKDLNLTAARNLADICTILGYNTSLTRTDDRMLYDVYGDFDNYTGKKKTYDLKNRLRMGEESGAALFISIHMNKFPQTNSKGLQVYYSVNTPSSENAAEMIQNYTKKHLIPWNERQIKPADSAIYLLHRIRIPAVLVECGFLSNPQDLENLTAPMYQVKLASCIFAASAEWLAAQP